MTLYMHILEIWGGIKFKEGTSLCPTPFSPCTFKWSRDNQAADISIDIPHTAPPLKGESYFTNLKLWLNSYMNAQCDLHSHAPTLPT